MRSALCQPDELVNFSVENLVDNSVTDFDLFLALENHQILYSGVGYRWYRAELEGLLRKGIRSLLIRRDDAPKAKMYQALGLLPCINPSLAPAERIQHLDDLGAGLSRCLLEGDLTAACVSKARDIATGLVHCISEDPSCIKAIRSLADHDAYTYHHSVRVAAYTVAIAVGEGIRDEELMFQMALGALFHDVGKKDVPLDLLHKRGPLTDEEWAIMRSHPLAGWQQLGATGLTHVSMEIVLHHHERLNGTGYPHGIGAAELLPEVQIATLADIYDALTSNRAYQQKRTRFEALTFIKQRLLQAEVSPTAFRALVEVLAG